MFFQFRVHNNRHKELEISNMTADDKENSIWIIFSIFFAVNLIVSSINHIDDTDEVYGYYEPLHYLLYGVGETKVLFYRF